MALKIDITDEKGVKTRYHKIKSFEYKDGYLKVTITSYVNQTTRDAERSAIEENKQAEIYDNNVEQLRAELDHLSAQLSPNGEGDADVITRVKELSQQVNDLVSNPDRPTYQPPTDKYYSEQEVNLPYFEPLTLDGIYQVLASEGRYGGAESI